MSPPRHLKMGDPFPPKTPGKLRLYCMQYCPFSLRARLLLEKHEVSYEQINIDLKSKPDWFLELYPIGSVPVIEIDDKLLAGSLVVAEFVDEMYGNGKRTLPTDPYEKGKINMLIADKFTKAISSIYQCMWRKENWEKAIKENLTMLDDDLKSNKFFVGDRITYADYMIWPWIRMLATVTDDVLPAGDFKNLERWIDEMKRDAAVKKCHTSPEILRKWAEGFKTGKFELNLE